MGSGKTCGRTRLTVEEKGGTKPVSVRTVTFKSG
jgi:hypothetical protein